MGLSLVLPVLAGIVAAAAANYIADELPLTRRLSRPACPQCNTPYPWTDYLLVRPCRKCGHSRGPRPWIVIVCLSIVSLFMWLKPHPMGYVLGLLLVTYFAVVVVIDLEHRLILHATSIVGAALALAIGLRLNGPLQTILGGLAGLLILGLLYGGGVLFSKLRARRMLAAGLEADDEEALGAGDVVLAGVLGLLLGWSDIGPGLLLGVLLAGLIALILVLNVIVRGQYGRQALMLFMPYGPSLVLGAFLILFLPGLIPGFAAR